MYPILIFLALTSGPKSADGQLFVKTGKSQKLSVLGKGCDEVYTLISIYRNLMCRMLVDCAGLQFTVYPLSENSKNCGRKVDLKGNFPIITSTGPIYKIYKVV